MPLAPWNWLWTATAAALFGRVRLQERGRAVLQPFVWSSAVAAAVAWQGITGPWHVLLFPVFPLLYVAATQMRLPESRPEEAVETGSITVAYGAAQPKDEPKVRRVRRPRRAVITPNPMTWSTVAWAPTATAAILLIAAGVHDPWVVALVFPLSPVLAAGLWRRLDRFKMFVGADVRVLATIVALEVGIAMVGIAVPEAVPRVFDNAATSGRPTTGSGSDTTTTTLPVVLAEGTGSITVVVIGTVARFDGYSSTEGVEGAFVTLTPAVGAARFAVSDVTGRVSFVLDPGMYSVAVVPPGNRWGVMRGCSDILEDFVVNAGESWTWEMPLVDQNAAVAYGSTTRCNELRVPVLAGAG